MSERLAHDDFRIADEKLCGTLLRTANDGHEAVDLPPRDQTEHAAGRASQHRPVGIFLFADFTGVLQNKNRSGLHLFGNPLAEKIKFTDHALLLGQTSSQTLKQNLNAERAAQTGDQNLGTKMPTKPF